MNGHPSTCNTKNSKIFLNECAKKTKIWIKIFRIIVTRDSKKLLETILLRNSIPLDLYSWNGNISPFIYFWLRSYKHQFVYLYILSCRYLYTRKKKNNKTLNIPLLFRISISFIVPFILCRTQAGTENAEINSFFYFTLFILFKKYQKLPQDDVKLYVPLSFLS